MNASDRPRLYLRLLRLAGRILFGLVLAVLALWCTMAVYYSNLPWSWLGTVAALAFLIGTAAVFVLVRPRRRAQLIFLGAVAVVIVWFLLIPPSNNRDWQPDVAVLPYAEINQDQVTIHNIRNCDYRTESDYTVRHYDKTFDLARLNSVDFFVVYWGSPLIAHTMLSFGFQDDSYVCFSIETRKEKGEVYSAIKGFFRQFELTYVVGDERDLVRLRTNFRGEQVYLYHLTTDPSIARLVFLDYLKEVNRLKVTPEWYNALTSNCTTNIRGHTRPYVRGGRYDWRILLNGQIDMMAYERGALDQTLPFSELKKRSLINDRAKAADADAAFSKKIRQGLPGFSSSHPVEPGYFQAQASAGQNFLSRRPVAK
jgi:hypothetical protein